MLRYLIYFSQVGFTVIHRRSFAASAAIWLKRRFGWGNGVVIIGIVLGIAVAACSLRDFLRLTERKASRKCNERKNGIEGNMRSSVKRPRMLRALPLALVTFGVFRYLRTASAVRRKRPARGHGVLAFFC